MLWDVKNAITLDGYVRTTQISHGAKKRENANVVLAKIVIATQTVMLSGRLSMPRLNQRKLKYGRTNEELNARALAKSDLSAGLCALLIKENRRKHV